MLEIIGARKGNVRLLGIAIEPDEPFVLVNGTQQLTARAKPASAQKGVITWSGGSSSSATVNATGLITGKSAQTRTTVTATSDAGVSTWVYVRCGYDVTSISLQNDEITIEGIQGVLFSVSFTPSNCTEISFAFRSSDSSVANYYWVDGSGTSYEQQRRMWGYSVGEAVVTAYGRSGNAQFPCNVTVTPVALQVLEFRALPYINGTIVTEQGDTIPNIATYVYTLVGARGSLAVYFNPFNATQRRFVAEIDDESIVTVNQHDGTTTYYDRQHGVARYETVDIHAKSEGNTNLTVTPEHGEGATIEIRSLASMSGTASWVERQVTSDPPYGKFHLSMTHYYDSINRIIFVSTTDPNRDNSTYRNINSTDVVLSKAQGSKSATWRGYWAVEMENGDMVAVSNTVSHYSPASE